MRCTVVVVLLAAAAACHAEEGDACDTRCPEVLECRGAAVTQWFGMDTTGMCMEPEDCPRAVTTCRDACELEGTLSSEASLRDPGALCAEAPDARAGDRCGDCRPTRAVARPDGTVTQTYLRCDGSVCVEAAPPEVPSWLDPCDDVVAPTPEFRGIVDACLVDSDATGECVLTGQTIRCMGDWDCPEGASCDDSIRGNDGHPYCRPGIRGAPIALGC